MAETRSPLVNQAVPDDLISFLMAIPDGRYRCRAALPTVVPAAGGSAGDPERLPQLP